MTVEQFDFFMKIGTSCFVVLLLIMLFVGVGKYDK